MSKKRKVLITALAMAAVLAGAALARAAMITVQSDNLGAGDTQVIACDPDGVGVHWHTLFDPTQDTYVIDSLTIDGIDPACNGHKFTIALTNRQGAKITEQAGVFENDQVIVNLPTVVRVDDVIGFHILETTA